MDNPPRKKLDEDREKRSGPGPHPNLWHPFSRAVAEGARLPRVESGRGAHVTLDDGRTILDCISSWWVNLHGHAHPVIADAIHAQAHRLEHVIFAGFTHEPAERLAEALANALPGRLSRVFFSDDGSTAVEIALKIAYQHWVNRGEKRSAFIAFEGAYHGDTFGSMSVGARSAFTEAFGDLLFEVEHLPFPATWIGDRSVEEREDEAVERVERRLADDSRPVAAVIVEPLVQGAGGMRMCRGSFLRRLRDLTRAHDTLLVFDEVMTGFGRTGEWFACERAGVEPDLICLAKGLTGGFVPLAATVASEEVFEAFSAADPARTFWHGHSYTANPIGCAAALASLELMEEHESAFRGMEAHHRDFLDTLDPDTTERRRVTGTIAAFDLKTEGSSGYFNRIGDVIKRLTLSRNLLIRPLGNTVYLMPPYCVTAEERDRMYQGVRDLVDDALEHERRHRPS